MPIADGRDSVISLNNAGEKVAGDSTSSVSDGLMEIRRLSDFPTQNRVFAHMDWRSEKCVESRK
jgi:ethanolamine ammonia-lyase large subunit